MKDFLSFTQSLIWPALIVWVALRYQSPILALLSAIQKRIEAGGAVKAGPFELSEFLHTSDVEQQKEKLEAEVSQLVDAERAERPKENQSVPPEQILNQLRAAYLQAEDLALREVQAEFGQPISRQLRIGGDLLFDGFFAKGGAGHIVEVKYTRHQISIQEIKRTIESIFDRIGRYGWRNVKIIFVIVFDREDVDLQKEKERMVEMLAEYGDRVQFRFYSMPQLERKLGATDTVRT